MNRCALCQPNTLQGYAEDYILTSSFVSVMHALHVQQIEAGKRAPEGQNGNE